ncbi:hypothetical protein [Clavibacter michiganensis]|uniref:hypothetical protein n=1 Tax=Clavibacter michiganensis TaxID=28447 RepID=UPI002930C3F5|nr:hypothetical protein [Clavibacter michiganensis]
MTDVPVQHPTFASREIRTIGAVLMVGTNDARRTKSKWMKGLLWPLRTVWRILVSFLGRELSESLELEDIGGKLKDLL